VLAVIQNQERLPGFRRSTSTSVSERIKREPARFRLRAHVVCGGGGDCAGHPGARPRTSQDRTLRRGVDRIGAAMVYEVRGLGTIVRCPSCDNALVRLAHDRGRYLVDLGGTRYLATG
jgi:hypothetical protein